MMNIVAVLFVFIILAGLLMVAPLVIKDDELAKKVYNVGYKMAWVSCGVLLAITFLYALFMG
jgi:hypothetical protein